MSAQQRTAPIGKADGASDREKFFELITDIRGPLIETVKALQPLVVLFSVSLVLATFTKLPFPEASDWSLVAAFGFGWALVFSAAVAGLRKPRPGFGVAMLHLQVLLGVFLGFTSLGLALVYMLLRSDLLHPAILFIATTAISLASVLWFYETWSYVRVAYRLAHQEGRSGRSWFALGWMNAAGIAFAVFGSGSIFWDLPPWGLALPLGTWAVGLGLVALARGIVDLAQKRRR